MKLLQSKLGIDLPRLFFIWDRQRINELPIGVPYIFADKKDEQKLVRVLEYEVLYQSALKSGYSFNFKQILKDNGFRDLIKHEYWNPVYYAVESYNIEENGRVDASNKCLTLSEYLKDSCAIVDVSKIKELKIIPVWVDIIEKALDVNIHNHLTYNSNMYNKKLEGMYGVMELTPQQRNLLIIDISRSIPKGVSSNILVMSKNLAESFYCDILITGLKSVLFDYNDLHKLNIETIYQECGGGQEGDMFVEIIKQDKKYGTCIVFGDNDYPGRYCKNRSISEEDGKKMCKIEIEKLISFHTYNDSQIAGYGKWFSPKEVESIKDWVIYLN